MKTTASRVLICLVVGLGLAACGGGSGGDDDNLNNTNNLNNNNDTTCTDGCDTEGATQCSSSEVERCEVDGDGCLQWRQVMDCSLVGQLCIDNGTEARCQAECASPCPNAGDTRCQVDVIQTCVDVGSGCLQWASGTDCSTAGMTCNVEAWGATCVGGCSPGQATTPTGPVPADNTADVPATTTTLDWADSANAARYAVYLGTNCPPPTYPGPDWVSVAVSELTGVSLSEATSYCWQVMALDAADCTTPGPAWSFTTSCTDPVPGTPTVTSPSVLLPVTTTTATFDLVFSEDVFGVPGGLTWTPVVGTGTMGTPVPVSNSAYQIPLIGLMAGDHYTLTVGTTIADACGYPLAAEVILDIQVDGQPGDVCEVPMDVSTATMPLTLTGTFDDDAWSGGSCDTSPTNTVWYTYTPTQTGPFEITAINATTTNAYSRLAVFEGTGCAPVGTELLCLSTYSKTATGQVNLTAGQSYTIAHYTDGESYTMVDPQLDIQPFVPDPGHDCIAAVDVSAATFPHQMIGMFEDESSSGGSCDTSPYNMVWYTYTPSQTGFFNITVTNGFWNAANSRLAVFEGTNCSPLGAELYCDSDGAASVTAQMELQAGVSYTIVHYTGSSSNPMEDPTLDIQPFTPNSSEMCGVATDVTGVTFPFQLTGNFTYDNDSGGDCSWSYYNGVWYTYTAPADGIYEIQAANNAATGDNSRLAVYEGTGCQPVGAEAGCAFSATPSIAEAVPLMGGQTYTITHFTGSDSYAMEDPSLSIQQLFNGTGRDCSAPVVLTGLTFPVTVQGEFSDTSWGGGSCDATPVATAWFSFTPTQTGDYEIFGENGGSCWSTGQSVVIFDGTSCSPLGAELGCDSDSWDPPAAAATLTAGVTYTIAFNIDNVSCDLIDPTITVDFIEPGERCHVATDITGATFPRQLTGTFGGKTDVNTGCGYSRNEVWYRYTAPTSGLYDILARNYSTTAASSRLAVYHTASCSPRGMHQGCASVSGKIIYSTFYFEAGEEYLIMFFTDHDDNTMVDPEITITPNAAAADAGSYCQLAVDLTGQSMPVSLTGTFEGDQNVDTSCDSYPTNVAWFTYTPSVTGRHDVDVSNASTDYSRLAIFEGTGCPPTGTEILCEDTGSSGAMHQEPILQAGQPYTFLFFTTSESYDMQDPQISVTPWVPTAGEACANPAPVTETTGSTVSVAGPFSYEDDPGSSCEPNPTNMAWLEFVPTTTGWYNMYFQNGSWCDVRMALYEGNSCSPYGAELDCQVSDQRWALTRQHLTAGTSYLIALSSDSETCNMSSVLYEIEHAPPPPGADCSDPAVTTSSNYYAQWGHDCWSWTSSMYDVATDHAFTCDGDTGADVVVEYTTASAQTTLNFSASISNYESGGYVGFEITDGPCASGTSLHCLSPWSSSSSGQVNVVPNTTYYFWVSDRTVDHYLPDVTLCLW